MFPFQLTPGFVILCGANIVGNIISAENRSNLLPRAKSGRAPLTETRCLRFDRKCVIQLCMLPVIPYEVSLDRRRLCGTLSKAFAKSRRIASICVLLSKCRHPVMAILFELHQTSSKHSPPSLPYYSRSYVDIPVEQYPFLVAPTGYPSNATLNVHVFCINKIKCVSSCMSHGECNRRYLFI